MKKGIASITNFFNASKSAANSGVTTRANSKKRSALGDISNHAPTTKAAKARKSAATESASVLAAPAAPPTLIEEVVVAVPSEAAPAVEEIVDIYSHPEARPYRELVSDFFSYLKKLEAHSAITPSYMTSKQRDITPAMRAILIDWLVEVAEEYKLHPETLFVCTALIDKSLSLFSVTRSNLQLLGCACMLIASKYEEVYSPSVDEFVYISDNTYTREQVLTMESNVLGHMQFKLAVATSKQFLHRFTKAAGMTDEQIALVNYLAELTLVEYDFLVFKPSVIAASCVLYARMVLGLESFWTPALEHYTEYSAAELWSCVLALAKVHAFAPSHTLHAVRDKYNHTATHHVSNRFIPASAAALEAARVALGVPAPDAVVAVAPVEAAPAPVPTPVPAAATAPVVEV